MSGGHAHHQLYRPGDTAVHRLAPQCKLVAVLTFVLIVVSTPQTRFWAFGAYAALLAAVAQMAHIPFGAIARRMVV